MRTAIKIFTLALFLFGVFCDAKASLINYSYTGPYFTNFSTPSSYTTSNRVTGSFTVDDSELPNSSISSLDHDYYTDAVTSIEFSDGQQTLTTLGFVAFGTNSAGDIITWSTRVENSSSDFIITYWFYSASHQDQARLTNTDYAYTNSNVDASGWNKSIVPIPSAVWLLGSGLVGIVGVRRKFKK